MTSRVNLPVGTTVADKNKQLARGASSGNLHRNPLYKLST
jgi:hypothetical protein